MDTNKGLCWRCGSKLPRTSIRKCDSCGIAEYCCNKCRLEDANRHSSVECPTWSPKKCANCGNPGNKECTACLSVWYCGAECQKQDWPKHQPACKSWQKRAKDASKSPFTQLQDLPYYFSNIIANDILKLEANEMEKIEKVEELNVLLAACGDLRHMVETVHSMPSKFRGDLRFLMNDIDPFVVARNVLLLYMMSTSEQSNAKKIATIWLSLRLSRDEYTMLQKTLSALCDSDSLSVRKVSRRVIDIDRELFNELRKVWAGWRNMPCLLGGSNCVQLDAERRAVLESDENVRESFDVLLRCVPPQYVSSINTWMEDGVIVAGDSKRENLPYYNPTLTGRAKVVLQTAYDLDPSNCTFQYCVKSDCPPFAMWDYLEMVKVCDASDRSITSQCHAYTSRCTSALMKMVAAKRLFVEIRADDYVTFKCKLPESYRGRFDRIYVSNLMDFQPMSRILWSLEDFLSSVNPCAVIITNTLNWTYFCEDGDLPAGGSSGDLNKVYQHILVDNSFNPLRVSELGQSNLREYYDNTTHFVAYLRGRRLADNRARNGGDAGKLPKWSDLIRCGGLTMRDFRKTRNSVWPFRQRVAARAVNQLTGRERTLEWYRE